MILASFERPSDVQFPPMEVQIFGIKKSPDTRKALRFFAERRVKTHFVDLQERAASPGELGRFVQKSRIGNSIAVVEGCGEGPRAAGLDRFGATAHAARSRPVGRGGVGCALRGCGGMRRPSTAVVASRPVSLAPGWLVGSARQCAPRWRRGYGGA